MVGANILDIIIDKLCYEKKLYPIILFKVDKNLEIGFYYTILSLNIAVCLRLEGNKEFLLDAKEIA